VSLDRALPVGWAGLQIVRSHLGQVKTPYFFQRPREVSPLRAETKSYIYQIFITRFETAVANKFPILLTISVVGKSHLECFPVLLHILTTGN
jgi:hypothetical protein